VHICSLAFRGEGARLGYSGHLLLASQVILDIKENRGVCRISSLFVTGSWSVYFVENLRAEKCWLIIGVWLSIDSQESWCGTSLGNSLGTSLGGYLLTRLPNFVENRQHWYSHYAQHHQREVVLPLTEESWWGKQTARGQESVREKGRESERESKQQQRLVEKDR